MMADVTVKVPEERVGEFYELVGRWLSGQLDDEPAVMSAAALKQWTNSAEDLVLARVVWEKFSVRAKALFSLLMDQPPGLKASADELATALDIPNGKSGVAGVLAWPARHCAAVNRIGPWDWEYNSDGHGACYWVDETTAALFRKVRG